MEAILLCYILEHHVCQFDQYIELPNIFSILRDGLVRTDEVIESH